MEKEGNNLFQVNLKGMIALLSEHIYSNPNTFVRELLQNCVDAITALPRELALLSCAAGKVPLRAVTS